MLHQIHSALALCDKKSPPFVLFLSAVSAVCSLLLAASQPASEQASGPAVSTATSSTSSRCDDTAGMSGLNVMGASMMAMMNHMCVTPLRPLHPGDGERAKVIVAEVKVAIEKYKNYKHAIADGYIQMNPKVDQPQFHFNNEANMRLAENTFDPTRPSSLLYRRTSTQRFKLEGVMFTAPAGATNDELDQRVPLSVARWHLHTNFCAAPATKTAEYLGAHPKFGMFGSVHTEEACKAEGGIFYPVIFNWMIHVFPYEDDFKNVFSMNDDAAHVH